MRRRSALVLVPSILLLAELSAAAERSAAAWGDGGGYGGLAHSRLPHPRDEAVRYAPGALHQPAATPRHEYGCENPPQSGMGFCNPKLGRDERLADLLGRLRLDEKLNFLSTGNNNISRLGLGSYSWWTEMLHGVYGGFSGASGFPNDRAAKPTIFPNGVGQAASFDPALVEAISTVISTEARALNNAVQDSPKRPRSVDSGGFQGLNGYAPNCNLYRDPRWGRAQETYGESVHQVSKMCAAYIRGLQGNHSKYLKIAATVKHYAFYSGPECDGRTYDGGGCQEFPGVGRGNFNAVVDAQDSFQTYLPMFERAVAPVAEGGGASAAIMSSFSHVNGVSMVDNAFLQQKVLREKFGFGDGMIVTDWGSISNYEGPDKWVEGQPACLTDRCLAQRAANCLIAGTDQDLKGGYFGVKVADKPLPDAEQPLPAAVRLGLVNQSVVDKSVRRVLDVFFRVGRFDPPESNPYRQIPFDVIGSPAHRKLARQAAAEAVVMLQNKNDVLPLDPASVRGLAVIGPAADAQYNASGYPFDEDPNDTLLAWCGDYSSCNYCPPNHTVSLAQGIRNHMQAVGKAGVPVLTTPGCGYNDTNTSGFGAALSMARRPDISHLVVVLGLSGTLEGEGNDLLPSRFPVGHGFGLPGSQQELLTQLASVGKPLVLLLVSGGSISVPEDQPGIDATLHALYPGVEAGNGIADLLFGLRSPASRLPMSIPKDAAQLPDYLNFSMVAQPFGRTHAWLRGANSEPRHEYGEGLSYSRFLYHSLQATEVKGSTDIELCVKVSNVGRENSWADPTDEVVLVFATWQVSHGADFTGRVPVRQLVAFDRLREIALGETRQWSVTLSAKDYALVNASGVRVLPTGSVTLFVGGHQPTPKSDLAAGTACVNTTLFIN